MYTPLTIILSMTNRSREHVVDSIRPDSDYIPLVRGPAVRIRTGGKAEKVVFYVLIAVNVLLLMRVINLL